MKHQLSKEKLESLKYVNIHQHTTHSLLDGIGHPKDHIKESFKKGHQGCAITDHGVMSGVLDLYYSSQDKNFLKSFNYNQEKYPVILGTELYIIDDTLLKDKKRKYHHVTLIAKNKKGYENLCYLTSLGTKKENFFTRPRISMKDLFDNKEGLIATSGCFIGYIPQSIFLDKGMLKNVLRKIFKDKTLIQELSKTLESTEHLLKMNIEPEEKQILKEALKESSHKMALEKVIRNKELQDIILESKGIPLDRIYINLLMENEELKNNEKNFLLRTLSEHTPEELLFKFKEEFKDDFYIEMHLANLCMRWNNTIKDHEDQGFNPQEKVNRGLYELIKKYPDVKTIICQDSHMPKKEHHILQSIMIWNSPSGKDGWHFPNAYYTMSVEEMYEKFKNYYPWMKDEEFVEWTENSMEVLNKCKDLKLDFNPSLPKIDYSKHYLNKAPLFISPRLKKILKQNNQWNESTKEKIIKNKHIKNIDLHEKVKDFFNNKNTIFNYSLTKTYEKKINKLDQNLDVLKSHFKNNNKKLYKILCQADQDIALKTALKVIINNEKLYPVKVDKEKLKNKIKDKFPNKDLKDFKGKTLTKIANKYNLYIKEKDPLFAFGDKTYQDRLVQEIELIQNNGINPLMNYFMLLEEIVFIIKQEGFIRGFGRGSGASSLLAYGLDITDIDPIKYNLLFERFLTKERIENNNPPDIDFDTNGKEKIKEYLMYHYGEDNVSLLGVFEYLTTKGAVKDVVKNLLPDLSTNDISKITKSFDQLDRKEYSNEVDFFNATLEYDSNLNKWFDKHSKIKKLVTQLIGNISLIKKHPVALIISGDNITKKIPCDFDYKNENMWIIQSDQKFLPKVGLIKFDFLPINILDEIQNTIKLIYKKYNKKIPLSKIPINDPLVLKEFKKGNTESIFQFNTQLSTNILTQINEINSINQLAMITSIARKGPLSLNLDKEFIKLINEENKPSYVIPQLKEVLKETYGLILYQEQAMEIFHKIGGFNLEESLEILDIMKNKSSKNINEFKESFYKHSQEKLNIKEKKVDQIWESLESFAKYSFNKSHAISYSKLAYCAMWLKTYFKKEWITSVLNLSDISKFKNLYSSWGTYLKNPTINISKENFIIHEKDIYMPLAHIKKMSKKAIDEIKNKRPFESFEDFYNKTNRSIINKTLIEHLILSGALDEFNQKDISKYDFRKSLFKSFEKIYADKNTTFNNFYKMKNSEFLIEETKILNTPAFDYYEFYKEKMRIEGQLKFGAPAVPPEKIKDFKNKQSIVTGGAVESIKIFTIKRGMNKGKEMAQMFLISKGFRIKVYVFSDDLAWDSSGKNIIRDLKENTPIIIKGKVSEFNNEKSVTFEKGFVLNE